MHSQHLAKVERKCQSPPIVVPEGIVFMDEMKGIEDIARYLFELEKTKGVVWEHLDINTQMEYKHWAMDIIEESLKKARSKSSSSLLPILDLEVSELATTAWKEVVRRAWARSSEIDTQRLNFHEITDQYHDDWMKLHRFEYDHFYSAWVGVVFRFRACAIHNQNFTEAFQRTGGASQDLDLYQEDDALFDFFVKGLSALESFYYSLYALGALIHTPTKIPSVPPPKQFPLLDPKKPKKLRDITPEKTLYAFTQEFRGLPITKLLDRLLKDTRYKEWKDIRNVLAHRVATAGRALQYRGQFSFQGGELPIAVIQWASDLTLDAEMTTSRYTWLKEIINSGLEETARFAVQQLAYMEDQLPELT